MKWIRFIGLLARIIQPHLNGTPFNYKQLRSDAIERIHAENEELAYVEGSWQKKHPLPDWMSKPLKQSYFDDFGVSTAPTMVIADRQGIVRLYHPGSMTIEALEAAVLPLPLL